MKNIVLLGAPGAGKGTQAVLIAERFGIPHISTGDILRRNINEGTELGALAKSFIDRGALVPDDVVIGLVESRLSESDAQNGYILDGFPRTIAQAEALDKAAKIDVALNIDVPVEIIVERLSGRRVCACGATYHTSSLGGSEICERCGAKLITREDDKPETVKARLKTYEEQTAPLIDYYRKVGKLVDIKASGSADETFELVKKALK